MTDHLKRFFAPKTWMVKRKGIKFVSKPSAGPHKREMALPMNVILRDIMGFAKTTREVKYLLNNKNIIVDGKRRKDYRFPVGLFDVIALQDINESFRMILNTKGKLNIVKIAKNESSIKPCKISGKKIVKGKTQLNLYDGKNLLVDKDNYKVGDVLVVDFSSGKYIIKDHLKLDKKTHVLLTGGKHMGHQGEIQDISGKRIVYKTKEGNVEETLKEYAFAVGKDKSIISLK